MNTTSKKQDYYQVMGLNKQSTTEQIKKAYKKLAVKWHPDKNPDNKQEATEKFRQISEAYQILTDDEKRKKYDLYGFDGPKVTSGRSYNFADANDIFKMFFKSQGYGSSDSFFNEYFKNKGASSSSNTYYTTKGSDGTYYRYTTAPGNSATYDKYADLLRGKTGQSSTSQTKYYTNSEPQTQQAKSSDQLPPKGHVIRQVHHVTRRTSDGKETTIKRTTLTNDDGSKQITEQNMDGTNKKVYHVLGGESKTEKQNKEETSNSNFSGYNFRKHDSSTSADTDKQSTPTTSTSYYTRKPSYTTKVYYADGTEAPTTGTGFGSSFSAQTYLNRKGSGTQRVYYRYK